MLMAHARAVRSLLRPSLVTSLAAGAIAVLAMLPGCSSDTTATPQAGIKFDVIPGNNGSAQCPVGNGEHFTVGGTNLDPVKDGDKSETGAGVSVTCSVHAQGSGFQVDANITVTGAGTFVISGYLDGTRNTQSNISGNFSVPDGTGQWSEKDCTVTFPDGNMGVASGRVWAQIDCPTAKDASRNTTCDASAKFRMENCNQ
jgi:hypothetical protein